MLEMNLSPDRHAALFELIRLGELYPEQLERVEQGRLVTVRKNLRQPRGLTLGGSYEVIAEARAGVWLWVPEPSKATSENRPMFVLWELLESATTKEAAG